jgi:circadian clock protein KaiB
MPLRSAFNRLPGAIAARLRLYIARSTPNSVRAQHNLALALEGLERATPPELEITDVFSQPKRAIIDGVVVTPDPHRNSVWQKMWCMGNLADRDHLQRTLQNFLEIEGLTVPGGPNRASVGQPTP